MAIPAIAAPMFRTSGPDLVVEACSAGVIGAFPALTNERRKRSSPPSLKSRSALRSFEVDSGRAAAPFAVNLIVHRTNPRWEDDLAVALRHHAPLIISSLGPVPDLVRQRTITVALSFTT